MWKIAVVKQFNKRFRFLDRDQIVKHDDCPSSPPDVMTHKLTLATPFLKELFSIIRATDLFVKYYPDFYV